EGFVGLISSEEPIKGLVTAEDPRGEAVLRAQKLSARRRERAVSRVAREADRKRTQPDRTIVATDLADRDVLRVREPRIFKTVAKSQGRLFRQFPFGLDECGEPIDSITLRSFGLHFSVHNLFPLNGLKIGIAVVKSRERCRPFRPERSQVGVGKLAGLLAPAPAHAD